MPPFMSVVTCLTPSPLHRNVKMHVNVKSTDELLLVIDKMLFRIGSMDLFFIFSRVKD